MVEELLSTWGYLAILVITFLEGESIVILAGALAQQGIMDPGLVALCALCGSFLGDQFYYTIGRHYGPPLLDRWPALRGKTEWAFRLVRKHETIFILSFRFIYGVRNVSPFVIAMSGVPRIRFMCLNFIAASIWAIAFTSIGYYSSKALERFFGEHQTDILLGLAAIALLFGLYSFARHFISNKQRRQEYETSQATLTAPEQEDKKKLPQSNTPRAG